MILANRMHDVQDLVLFNTKCGFFPGMKISDSILLAHELIGENLSFEEYFP